MPTIKVDIDPILLTELQELAQQQDRSVASILRQLAKEAAKKGKAQHDEIKR